MITYLQFLRAYSVPDIENQLNDTNLKFMACVCINVYVCL